jgi:hypothetical protein
MSNDKPAITAEQYECPECSRMDFTTRKRIDWKHGRKVDQYSCVGCWKNFLDMIDAMQAMNGPGA